MTSVSLPRMVAMLREADKTSVAEVLRRQVNETIFLPRVDVPLEA